MAQDRRLACANLVDPAANDFQRLAQRALVCRLLFSVGQLNHHIGAVKADGQIGRASAGQASDRTRQTFDGLDRGGHAVRLANAYPQNARRALLKANGANSGPLVAQSVADFGPQGLHPLRIDVLDLDLGQQVRPAAQVETQIDQARRQKGRPLGRDLLVFRCVNARLDRGNGIVRLFHARVEQVWQRKHQSGGHEPPDQDALPQLELQH